MGNIKALEIKERTRTMIELAENLIFIFVVSFNMFSDFI